MRSIIDEVSVDRAVVTETESDLQFVAQLWGQPNTWHE